MSPLERSLIEKSAFDNGWENIVSRNEASIIAGSARHSAQVSITPIAVSQWQITFSKQTLTAELSRNFKQLPDSTALVIEAPDQLPVLLRRAAELALALPTRTIDIFQSRVKSEMSKIQNAGTEVERLVKQRIGQNTFREALMDYWGSACAVTGINIPEVLRASHTKPWAKCDTDEERLDVFNGFLLSANLDALFDKGLISFDDQGRMLFSCRLSEEQISMLKITDGMRLRWLAPEHNDYLRWHREHLFQHTLME